MNFTLKPIAIALLGAALSACITVPDGTLPKAALDDALTARPDAVPLDVQQELLNGQSNVSRPQAEPRDRRFNIAASNVEAKGFFNALANQHGASIAVHPDVEGTISLNLRQVTLADSLAVLSQLYGYGIERKNGVYQVFPNGVRTRTFNVNYLMLSRTGQSQTAISGSSLLNNSSNNDNGNSNSSSNSSSSGDATRISTESTNDFWADLESALGRLIGSKDDRVVVTNPQAGLVIVRATPNELALVEGFLNQAERQLKRQVILEARIVEVELSDGFEQGIDWQRLSRGTPNLPSNAATPPADYLNPISSLANLGGSFLAFTDNLYTFTDGDFSAVLRLLSTQGEVNTLSNPRVTTSNNQKAVIKVGTDEYFVTNFTLETTTNNNNTQQAPDLELSPFFSGISLDVTPQISEDNKVLLHIHPTVSEVTDNNKVLDLGTGPIVLPLARSTVRESDTIVEARSGEMIIIGGLMQEKQISVESGVPLLSQIPVLGNLFKTRSLANKKSELVIMLRPVVVTENTWQDELQRSRDLLDKWYPEPQPIRSIDSNQPMSQQAVRSGTGIVSSNKEPIRAIDRSSF